MVFFFQAEDGIRDAQESRGLGDVYKRQTKSPFLGECRGVGVYLLYNGILDDKSAQGGNVLNLSLIHI